MSERPPRPAPSGRVFRLVVGHALGGLLPALSLVAAAGCQRDANAAPPHASDGGSVRPPVQLPSLPPPPPRDAGTHGHGTGPRHPTAQPKEPTVGVLSPRRTERRATDPSSPAFVTGTVGGRRPERG